MSFLSLRFCLLFAVSLFAYHLFFRIKRDRQWTVLLIASYVFYMWGDPRFVIFLLFSTFTTWFFPLLMGQQDKKIQEMASRPGTDLTQEEKKDLREKIAGRKKSLLVLCLACNIGLLSFLKYTNFFIRFFRLFGITVRPLSWLILPLGISFYTFQSVGYCIDVYKGTVEPERDLFRYALYVSFFPQISQGPIGRYAELAPQLYAPHKFCYEQFAEGLVRMLLGFFKKLFIADRIGLFVDQIYGSPADRSGSVLVIATVLYAFQLYADFSGYMDIALGAGKCFGIQLSENFQTPYLSRSIPEYWRRWHITLGAWFRDYLYYPLMRSRPLMRIMKDLKRSGRKRAAMGVPTAIALFITWTVIGFWHGAAWKFIAHGLFHGSFVILSAVFSREYKILRDKLHVREESSLWHGFQILRTFLIVNVGYVLFRSGSLIWALRIYKRIFTEFDLAEGLGSMVTGQFTAVYWIMVVLSILILFLLDILEQKERSAKWIMERCLPLRWGILYLMIFSVLYVLLFTDIPAADAGNFLYFDF